MLVFLLAIILGFTLLVKGSDYFVDGVASIARKFGIPQIIIGLTIVAMGTSAPEAAISIAAAFRDAADITIGNIVGSNILNVFIILGITAAITPTAVQKSTIKVEIPFMIGVSAILMLLGRDGIISLIDGFILCLLFGVYIGYLFFSAKKNKEVVDIQEEEKSLGINLLYAIGGIAAIIIGSKVTVYGATGIAQALGISDRFIGLTVVAFGTSLPELFTSVTAAKKGNADIAIGNIVGSNIFNILFVIGLTSLITQVPYATAFMIDSIVMIFAGVVLLIFVHKTEKLNRIPGLIMLAMYAGYFIYLAL